MGTIVMFFSLLASFFLPRLDTIANYQGTTNILVMGIAGGDHAGEDLTDTMIVASISSIQKTVDLVSIPRDLWMPDIRAKINSAYHYGGNNLAKKEVEEVIGMPIHYTVLINFSGFKDIVDAIGGVEVNVENTFTDNFYPIAGRENDTCGGDRTYLCRYESITFEKGLVVMDGTTALKFVRSRHAEGLEGTDQAREARQQKVIEAIKNKLLTASTFLNPIKDKKILEVLKATVVTDIDFKLLPTLGRILIDARNSIASTLIPEELLVNPPIGKTYDNQYVFIPKAGNGKWGEINFWFLSVTK